MQSGNPQYYNMPLVINDKNNLENIIANNNMFKTMAKNNKG